MIYYFLDLWCHSTYPGTCQSGTGRPWPIFSHRKAPLRKRNILNNRQHYFASRLFWPLSPVIRHNWFLDWVHKNKKLEERREKIMCYNPPSAGPKSKSHAGQCSRGTGYEFLKKRPQKLATSFTFLPWRAEKLPRSGLQSTQYF